MQGHHTDDAPGTARSRSRRPIGRRQPVPPAPASARPAWPASLGRACCPSGQL